MERKNTKLFNLIKGLSLDWVLLSEQFSLLNFAVAGILSVQALKEGGSEQGALGKIAFSLFILATLTASLALVANLSAGRGFASAASFQTALLAFHIAGASMGLLLALASSFVAILYLWQRRLLKQRLLGSLTTRVPAMDVLAKILMAGLWAGFLFLTAALLSGAYFMQFFMQQLPPEGLETYAYREKFLWASSVWAWYLAALLARNVVHLPVKRVAQMCLMGMFLLALTFFGWSFLRAGGVWFA